MPIIAWFFVLILSVPFIVGFIVRLLAMLGLSYYVFTGVDIAIDTIHDIIFDYIGTLPSAVVQLLDTAGVTTGLTWILNAYLFLVFIRLAHFTLFGKTFS